MKNIIIPKQHFSLASQTHPKQQGFTIVEVFVALTIGLLMMLGIMQISLASKESARLQRNLSFVQENIRTSMDLLGRDIRQAGFYTDNNAAARILTPPTPFVIATTSDGGGANNDDITVTYESDIDCLGQATPVVAGNRFAVNHYFISNERLMCRGNGNARALPLVEGVENMQILYGENTDNEPLSANRYVSIEQANPDNIVSVRISMRYHSREPISLIDDTNLYALLDGAATYPTAGDRRLRRQVTTTISLRN